MKLTLVTPEKTVLDSIPVQELLVPGEQGEIGILPGHAPLISTLSAGLLKYRLLEKGSSFQEVAVSWGYCEVQPDKVVVLAESAETKKELDKTQTQRALKELTKKLENPKLSPKDRRELSREEKKQKAFLELINKNST